MKYIFLLLFIIPISAFSEIYKWTDESGNVHFGDSPKDKDKAEKIVVEVNSYENVTYDDVQFYQGSESNNVTMYATSWCGYCKKARQYFQQQGIPFVEKDIEQSADAKREHAALGGGGVPLFSYKGRTKRGFSVGGFESFYRQK